MSLIWRPSLTHLESHSDIQHSPRILLVGVIIQARRKSSCLPASRKELDQFQRRTHETNSKAHPSTALSVTHVQSSVAPYGLPCTRTTAPNLSCRISEVRIIPARNPSSSRTVPPVQNHRQAPLRYKHSSCLPESNPTQNELSRRLNFSRSELQYVWRIYHASRPDGRTGVQGQRDL